MSIRFLRCVALIGCCVGALGCTDPVSENEMYVDPARFDMWVPPGNDGAVDGGQSELDQASEVEADALDASPDTAMAADQMLVDGDVVQDAQPIGDSEPGDMEPVELPTFEHFDTVVDLARREHAVWAYFFHVERGPDGPHFVGRGYADTADRNDFWPASTIKFYTATAALVLLEAEGLSLDAEATFYHQDDGAWVEDVTLSVREVIRRTFNCSSNEAYTLLLRLAGLDWLNQTFFVAENGFQNTALMRGYVLSDARPWVYRTSEPQRIVLREGPMEVVREHRFSGTSYADEIGCTVYNDSGTANCTSPRDLAEHMRRVMYHEELPLEERFPVAQVDLDWLRRGGPDRVLNNGTPDCGGPGWEGVARVFPEADFFHKSGLVSEYRLDLLHVRDEGTGTEYILAAAFDSPSTANMLRLSEEVARMARTPRQYVFLDYLVDNVNPVVGDVVVYSESGGTVELITKDYGEDGYSVDGWQSLPGTRIEVGGGGSAHSLISECLGVSEQVHIRGRLMDPQEREAISSLHYVIVDADVACE